MATLDVIGTGSDAIIVGAWVSVATIRFVGYTASFVAIIGAAGAGTEITSNVVSLVRKLAIAVDTGIVRAIFAVVASDVVAGIAIGDQRCYEGKDGFGRGLIGRTRG